jgi:hypothetical protein
MRALSIAFLTSFLSAVALGQEASPKASAKPAPKPSPKTDLVQLEILPSGEDAHGGECWERSKVLRRAGAWRCTDNASLVIFDPCVSPADDDEHVICLSPSIGASPREVQRAKLQGTRLELVSPLPANGWKAYEPVHPFQLRLQNGDRCVFARPTVRLPKAELHYACTGGWLLLGEPTVGKPWTVTEVRLDADRQQITERRDVAVTTVWY